MSTISFKPKQVTKKLLSPLSGRAKDVLTNRFGLTDDAEPKTLEAIGKGYGITRERVRQIENFAIGTIKKSDAYKELTHIFEELRNIVARLGSIIGEEELLNLISKDKQTQNHINLYLELSDKFKKHKEDDTFTHRWSIDDNVASIVHESLRKLYATLSDQDLISEDKILATFIGHLKELSSDYKHDEILRRYLKLSKLVNRNQLGEWGKATSPHVRARGIKDYAYLVMRKAGKPMHFKEVAHEISKLFGKKAHVATTHNELIKDKRFVLIGRGIYALKEWGYKKGTVADIITEVLQKAGEPLHRDDIVKEVLKSRYVKETTILLNLQGKTQFKRVAKATYALAE